MCVASRSTEFLTRLVGVLLLALTVQNAAVQWHRARAVHFDRAVTWTPADAMSLHREPLPEPVASAAHRAAHHYRRADRLD